MGTEIPLPGDRAQGLAFHDPRFSRESVRAIGAAAGDSSYTEADATAGTPLPDTGSAMVLKQSGSPSDPDGFEVVVQDSGHPLPDQGSFLLKVGKRSGNAFGHDNAQVLMGVEALSWAGAGAAGSANRATAILLQSGVVLIAEHADSGAPLLLSTWTYDPTLAAGSTSGLSAPTTFNVFTELASRGADDAALELLQLPSGRVLLYYCDLDGNQIHCAYSDDDGTSWEVYTRACLLGGAIVGNSEIHEIEVSFSQGTVLMFLTMGRPAAGNPNGALQFVSHDLGATFEPVGVDWASAAPSQEQIRGAHLIPLPSGQHVLVYWGDDTSGAHGYYSRVLDPGTPGYNTTRVALAQGAASGAPALAQISQASVAAWADEDGVLYALVELGGTGLTGDQATVLLRSTDGAASWERFDSGVLRANGAAAERPHDYTAVAVGGRTLWITRFEASASPPHPTGLVLLALGGHATATVGIVDDDEAEFGGLDFVGWGAEPGARFAGCWFPAAPPGSMGWTTVAGGGTEVWHATNPERTVTTTANTRWWYWQDPTNKPEVRVGYVAAICRVTAGGNLAALDCAFTARISDYDQPGAVNATAIYEVQISCTTTHFRVKDGISGAQIGGDQAWDMTKPTLFLVMLGGLGSAPTDDGAIFYGHPGEQLREMNLHSSPGTLTNDAGANPTNPCRVEMGNISSGTASSHWRLVGFNFGGGAVAPDVVANFLDAWTTPRMLRGRHFSTFPAHVYDDWRLSASRGPARAGETWRCQPTSPYAIDNLFPLDVASPRDPWRSKADGVVERIALDLDIAGLFVDAFMGNSVLLFGVFGANVKKVQLLGWDPTGAGSWDTLIDLDLSSGFGPLAWERAGYEVRPDNGQISVGDYYLWREEHAGDTFNLGVGEEPLKRIRRNTEGAWRADGTGVAKVKQPTAFLDPDGWTGTESSSGVAGEIWVRDAAGILREYAGKYQRFAIQVPAHSTADGYYQIGTIVIGDVLVLGQQYDLGWTVTRLRNLDVHGRRDGARTFRRNGPQRRRYQLAWVETAVQARGEQAVGPDPDYRAMGATAGFPVASRGDVLRALEGALEAADGPMAPAVLVTRIEKMEAGESEVQTVTRRRQLVLCRVETDPLTETLAARRGEMVDEAERLNPITATEVP